MADSNKSSNTRSKKTKEPKKRYKALKIILLSFLALFILLGVAAGGLTLAVVKTSPELNINQIVYGNEASKIYDDKGDFMDKIITTSKKTNIKYEDMPENLIHAFVSIEDERFFKHNGIDIKRIVGVIIADIKNTLSGNSTLQGGSTITQQLIKTTFYDYHNEGFTDKVKRKIQEWFLAPELEKKVGKETILEAYLNSIFLGGRATGVEAAAQQYFKTNAKNLTLTQCAFIAGLTQSPSVYYPYSKTSLKKPSTYINRTKTVLSKMLENGYISQEEYDASIAELNIDKNEIINEEGVQTLGKTILGKATANGDKYNYEWFSRPTVIQVKEDLKKAYNYTDEEIENLLVNGNLKIYSTMNKDLQETTQKILNEDETLNRYAKNDEEGSHPQASAVIVDYNTGETKAIIGGRGEQPAMSYNRAMDAKVPPGSGIKPLTVYAPAIDTKIATAATVIEDSPLSTETAKKYSGGGNLWQPRNASGTYSGYLNLRNAIKDSVNVFAVKLEDMIGLDTGFRYGKKFGLNLDEVDRQSIAALSLGELNSGTNTFTMANAYGVFGNNGLYTKPRLYTRVVDKIGKTVLESKIETEKVISPQAAYIMYDLLKGPVKGGTATKANYTYNSETHLAGKTGSSTGFKNVWFNALTPYYSASVWIENKYQQPIYSSHAAYLMGKIMNEAVKDLPVKDITAPSGITSSAIDRVSGLLPSELSYMDPRGSQVYNEIFIKGTVPTTVDNIHVGAQVNKLNGRLATSLTPSSLAEYRVFIRRDYIPSVPLGDQAYVLPGQQDNMTTPITKEPNSNNEIDLDEDQIKDDEKDEETKVEDNNNNNNNGNENGESTGENSGSPETPNNDDNFNLEDYLDSFDNPNNNKNKFKDKGKDRN